MNTKLLVSASLLLLAMGSTPAMAYADDRDVVLPGGWNDAFTGGASLAFCERVSDDATLSGTSPIYCERSGFGAIFADVGCSADFFPVANPAIFFGNGQADNAPGCLDDIDGSAAACCDGTGDGSDAAIDNFATGSVTVKSTGTLAGTKAQWLVGNDRDDDGSVTSGDNDGSSDTTDENTADDCDANNDGVDDPASSGCFDDEFIFSTTPGDVVAGFTTPNFCFSRDRAHAGGDWDDIVVFFSADLPPATPPDFFVGTADVDLTVNSQQGSCTRSGHADGLYHGGGNPALPTGDDIPDVFLPVGVVGIGIVDGVVDITLDLTDMDCGVPVPPGNVGTGTSPVTVTCTANGNLNCQSAAAVFVGTVGTSGSVTCGPNTANVSAVPPANANSAAGVGPTMSCTINAVPPGGIAHNICVFVVG